MHGKRLLAKKSQKETQKRIDEIAKLQNLINKIVLSEAGYFGSYRDCAAHEQRTLQNPEVELQKDSEVQLVPPEEAAG
jgi:hypothetical protein